MTDSQNLPSFDDCCDILQGVQALNSPAEMHGFLCGRLSGGVRYTLGAWVDVAVECLDMAGQPDLSCRELLEQVYDATLSQLLADDFGLTLLLPEDDDDIGERVLALGQWCNGYLSGFGSSGLDANTKLSAEAAEAMRDLAAIAQVGPDDDAEDDCENNFAELSEFVRIAALMLFTECGHHAEDTNSHSEPQSLH